MTIHLSSAVIHGYFSNEVPGLITGQLHLAGQSAPLTLQLEGNFLRDIAGCRLDVTNPIPEALPGQPRLSVVQEGTAGEMTASRRILRTPRKTAVPKLRVTGLKNFVFFEWFNESRQRIVIQSWHWSLRVSAPAWRLHREQEIAQIKRSRALRKDHLLNQSRPSPFEQAFNPTSEEPFAPATQFEDPFSELANPTPQLPELPRAKDPTNPQSPAISARIAAGALSAELDALETFLSTPPVSHRHHVLMDLLTSILDLSAQLRQTMFQIETLQQGSWSHLLTDVEQSIPLFSAAAAASERMLLEAGNPDPVWWNTSCRRLRLVVTQTEMLLELLRA